MLSQYLVISMEMKSILEYPYDIQKHWQNEWNSNIREIVFVKKKMNNNLLYLYNLLNVVTICCIIFQIFLM